MWFVVAVVINVVMATAAWWQGGVVDHAVEASLLALVVSIGARNDGIVRMVFIAGRLLPSYPLHQLTYHLGQLHRTMAIAATMWFAVAVARASTDGDAAGRSLGVTALIVLVVMMWTAQDARRHDHHDRFERVHRYGGWTALIIVAGLVSRQAAHTSTSAAGLVTQPPMFLLIAVVLLVVQPWWGVRRLPVEVLTVTSDVIVVALPGSRRVGEFVRVSRDGGQWHSFAVATTGREGPGRYCLVIRRAGDWTDRLASDAETGHPPTHLLVRRIRGYGFMYHAQTYRRVLFVATGAGIGPALPYLVDPTPVDYECLWIGRDHRQAMGPELVERILHGGRVTLIDTVDGRPDIGAHVAAVATRFDAVFVISNHHVRDQVALACQHHQIPWYGPTFDS